MTTPRKKRDGAKSLPSEAPSRPEVDRRLRQADRLARVLRVLQLLLSRGRWDAKDIAGEQEVSERTVYRDIQVLELAGIPVEFDKEEMCYRVRQDFRFPTLNLTEDEALGQGVAAAITKGSGLDISSGARIVARKLAASSKEEVAQLLEDAEELVAVLDLKLAGDSRHRDFIQTVQWALIKRKQLSGSYRSPYEDKEVKIQLHPIRLCLVKAAWYLVARPVGGDDARTYRVVRFKSLRMTDHNAEVPESFDLRSYFGNAWAVYRGEQSYDVEVLFTKEAAAQATETIWHHTQKMRKQKDGTVTLTFQVDGLNELVRWVLGWGNRIVVIRPVELKKMVAEQLRSALEPYQMEFAAHDL